MTKEKKWKNYFICKGKKGGETNCGRIFFNDDDNVCIYCGSKNTRKIIIEKIKRLPIYS